MASTKRINEIRGFLVKAVAEDRPITRELRYVSKRFKSLKRSELLVIAKDAGINLHTASTQFYKARHP